MTDSDRAIFWREAKRRWILPYLDAAGEKRQHIIPPEVAPTARDRKLAEKYATTWRAHQRENGGAAPLLRAEGPTTRALHEKWLDMRRGAKVNGEARYAAATLGDYAQHLRTHILPALGDVPLVILGDKHLRPWVVELGAKHSSSTARNVYSTLRSMIDDAMAEGWVTLAGNPLRQPALIRALPPPRRETGVRPLFVELEYAQAMVRCGRVPVHRRVRYLVELCTGLSEGELAGRRWRDVDWCIGPGEARPGPRPVLQVVDALPTRGPDGWATMGRTKNEYRIRTLPLHAAAASALAWWWAEGWREYVGRAPAEDDPVFPGPTGGFSRPAAAALLRTDLRAAGCPDRSHGHPLTAQAMRRSFATYLDAVGIPEEVRGRLLGHVPKTVTGKHYTAAQIETDRAAVNLIALRWAGPDEVPEEEARPAARRSHAQVAEAMATVHRAIIAVPGLGATALAARLGLGSTDVRLALRALCQRGAIVVRGTKRAAFYQPAPGSGRPAA